MSHVRDRAYRRYTKEKVVRKRLWNYVHRSFWWSGVLDCYDNSQHSGLKIFHTIGTYVHTRQFSTYTADNNRYRPRYNQKKWNHRFGGNHTKDGFGQRSKERECSRKEVRQAIEEWYRAC